MALDKETEDRIEQPASEEAERETRLTPTQAIAQMKINVPVRGNRKLRRLLERVNEDPQLKGWWHAANVNAVARMPSGGSPPSISFFSSCIRSLLTPSNVTTRASAIGPSPG